MRRRAEGGGMQRGRDARSQDCTDVAADAGHYRSYKAKAFVGVDIAL